MAGIFTKAKKLLAEGNLRELSEKVASYLRYLLLCAWYRLTGRETDPELKKTNKNWVVYTWLRKKYSRFLKRYGTFKNETHEYSDIVWWCWLQGEENAPPLVKACLASLRRQLIGKKIIVITEENMADYASFPSFIMEKYRKGIISRTHFSDLLRLELLIRHGGTWVDATVYCTGNPEYVFKRPLFVFKTNERNDPATAAQNWFISAEKHNPVLTLTQDLLYDYWKKTRHILHYFLFYFFMKMAAEVYADEWRAIPFFSDVPPHILQRELSNTFSAERLAQIRRMSDIHKLSYKLGAKSVAGTFWEHIVRQEKE